MVVDDLGGAVRNQQRGVRVVSLKIHLGCIFLAGGSYFVYCQHEVGSQEIEAMKAFLFHLALVPEVVPTISPDDRFF